ncbi:MAG: hypothetical protein Q8O89_03265 [Nanoarchaeota archaeon]|nr:hypothetical protein [Nanoarchaeota archaeon]
MSSIDEICSRFGSASTAASSIGRRLSDYLSAKRTNIEIYLDNKARNYLNSKSDPDLDSNSSLGPNSGSGSNLEKNSDRKASLSIKKSINNIDKQIKKSRSKAGQTFLEAYKEGLESKLYIEVSVPEEIKQKYLAKDSTNEDLLIYSFEASGNIAIKDKIAKSKEFSIGNLLDAYKAIGLVGEEKNAILQTYAAIHGMNFGVEGPSGSGKTQLVKSLMKLLPDNAVYEMELSSKTAELYNADEINRAKIIYIPELQKALTGSPLVLEIVKTISEGRDVVRKIVSNGKTKQQIINSGKSFIYTLADENKLKKDAELSRRFFTIKTDTSDEQTDKVLSYLALGQYSMKNSARNSVRKKGDAKLTEDAKAHIEASMSLNCRFLNPFADYIAQVSPNTLDMRSKLTYYFNFINASARFNFRNRLACGNDIFVSIEDIYNVNNLLSDGKKTNSNSFFDNFNYADCFTSSIDALEDKKNLIFPWIDTQKQDDSKVIVKDFITGKNVHLLDLSYENIVEGGITYTEINAKNAITENSLNNKTI